MVGASMNRAETWRESSRQIGAWAAQRLSEHAITVHLPIALSVAECLPVLEVMAERVRGATVETWFDALRWTGQWHCQINHDDRAVALARVVETGATVPLDVLSWSRGGMAVTVHESLALAGQELDADAFDVAFVEIPPLGLSALLFVPRAPETRAFVSLLRSRPAERWRERVLIPLQVALDEIASLPFVQGGEADDGVADDTSAEYSDAER